MRTSFHRFVTTIKSGIGSIPTFFRNHKKTVAKYLGRIVIFVAKTLIEMFIEDLF